MTLRILVRLCVVLPGAAWLLTGCGTAEPAGMIPASAGTSMRPAGYEQSIRSYIRNSFIDPGSVIDASISDPFRASVSWDNLSFPQSAWAVCLEANGKNRFGGYTGRQYTILRIEGGRVTAAVSDEQYGTMAVLGQAHQNCPGRQYRPL